MLNRAIGKLILVMIFLTGLITTAFAQNEVANPNLTPIPNSPGYNNSTIGTATNTNAAIFAVQAGSIAGAAQSCGQDVTIFLRRVNEALDRIALSSTDKVIAMARLQEAMTKAQAQESTKQVIPCAQVMQDFISLPLMRDDYQQTVLNQLSPTMGAGPIPPTTIPQGNPPGNLSTGPSPGALVGNQPPNVNVISPGGTPPRPDFPDSSVANRAPNIIHQAPSIGPPVDTTRRAPNINELAPDPYRDINPPATTTNPFVGSFPTQEVEPPASTP